MYAVRVIYLSFFKAYVNPSRPFSLRDQKKKIFIHILQPKKGGNKEQKKFFEYE